MDEHATEGGARIRGTEIMDLREVAGQFCEQKIDSARFAYRQTVEWRDPSRLDAARAEVEKRIEELDSVVEVCDELLLLFKELEGLTTDPPRFNRRLVRVDELRAKVQQQSRGYQIVASATQLAELRRYSADRRIGTLEGDDAERARQQIQRDTEFITSVRDGAKQVKPVLGKALERIVEGATKE